MQFIEDPCWSLPHVQLDADVSKWILINEAGFHEKGRKELYPLVECVVITTAKALLVPRNTEGGCVKSR